MRATTVRRSGFGLALLCAATLAAGCGSSDDTASTSTAAAGGSSGATETTAASSGVADAQKELDAYRGVPTFEAPGEPFDARRLVAGKTLMSIPASSSIPFVQTLQDGVRELSGEVGMRFLDWPNQGKPVEWVQGMNAGVDRRVNAINLMAGINPGSIGPQVSAAKAARIPVIASHLYDVGDTPAEGVDTVSIPYEQAGRLLADWVVARTGGKGDTLVVKIDEVVSTAPMMRGIQDVFDRACGDDCPVSTINVAIADVATKIQPQVQSELVKNPNIRYVIALYDSAEAPFVVAAIKAAGAASRVRVVTFNGTPSVLRMVKSGDVEMDVAENLEWVSYAITDQAMRLIGGLEPVSDPKLPLRIFDADNIDEAGTNPATAEGFGDEYRAGYRKLWGLGG
ncbi:substrate-binding domain-containing protein [Conexibacter sp. CPCC 206217]|uniref:sugar ABC transporter substrate-binding protein n=1 Tax=Conexibacter sp. CPCC 206217 TaxID=3064574 RepID=UPI0027199549|nr:substrate-binding domain-containing protein [Conexibacter sp. CPCC 206217]MDO8213287.1 substrate-binding domain-containing protein [Conexibacter sp. CPCC 206217]